LVANITPQSPAARAGLRTGDVIISVDGQSVDDPNAFDYRFATKPLGGAAKVGLLRGGREQTIAVALETAPDSPHDELLIKTASPFQGAKVANLSPALADTMRLDPSNEGVVIVEIAAGSLAQRLGFQRGDVVTAVNTQKITKTRDLERATSQATRLWRVTIRRGGQEMSVELRG
jgi:S1-C subfamily serine protease